MNLSIGKISDELHDSLEASYPSFIKEVIQYNRIEISRQQAWSIYSIRYNIKLEKDASFDRAAYKQALDNLSEYPEESVSVHTFLSKNKHGVIGFTDTTDRKIIGLFKLINLNSQNE